jgi:anti-sigma factor RsiW
MAITDETLMAYADGVLDAEEAREVERAMAADEALAARVAALADARRAVKAAHAAPEPVPEALLKRVQALAEADAARRSAVAAGTVVDLSARRRPAPLWKLPLAASVALAAGGLAGWFAAQQAGAPAGIGIAGLDDPAIVRALGEAASGERVALPGGAELAAIATFRDGDGTLCREFEYDRDRTGTIVAVACRGQDGWDVRLAVAAPAAEDGGYAPASSLDTLEAFLAATGAGAALSPEEERAALEALR